MYNEHLPRGDTSRLGHFEKKLETLASSFFLQIR